MCYSRERLAQQLHKKKIDTSCEILTYAVTHSTQPSQRWNLFTSGVLLSAFCRILTCDVKMLRQVHIWTTETTAHLLAQWPYGLDLRVVSSSQGRSHVTGWMYTQRSGQRMYRHNTNTDRYLKQLKSFMRTFKLIILLIFQTNRDHSSCSKLPKAKMLKLQK